MSLNLYQFYWDLRRQGSVEGLFIATSSEVDGIIGKNVEFGEILGKHSDVYGTIEEGEITLVSDDSEKVEWLGSLMESRSISGYNPFDYVEYEEIE